MTLTALTGVVEQTPDMTMRQLRQFIVQQVTDFEPDVVIVTERKGTAIYRAVLESVASEPFQRIPSWEQVVSSSSLSSVPLSRLAGAKLLVVDDMVRRGKTLRNILEQLRSLGATDDALGNVRVAAFAMHEEAGTGYEFHTAHFPDAAWLQHLPTEAFRQTRARLITALQRAGSLMLDTEHVEVRLRLRAPINRLAEALSRSGEVVVFNSGGDRRNLTVFYEKQMPDEELSALPPGTRGDGVVRKCRVVERLPGEFALIPISLPDTPCTVEASWKPAPGDSSILGHWTSFDDEARFHAVALRASLDPLLLALRDISAARDQICEVYLPEVGGTPTVLNAGRYDLNHLRVVYPTLDITAFHARLSTLWHRAQATGTRLRARKWQRGRTYNPSREALETAALSLLQEIERIADRRAAERTEARIYGEEIAQGITMREVASIGRSIGLPKAIVSSCMDVLIDEAMLVTKVERVQTIESAEVVCRTYLPDGEVATDLVRDYTRRHGLLKPESTWD